jgi:serine/threonine-protein kinase RsbW
MTNAGTDFMPDLAAPLNPAARAADPRCGDAGPCGVHGITVSSRPKRRVFPGRPDQVACARRFVSRVLAPCPAANDAVLLASELATNALQHTATGAGGEFEVIACHGQGRIRVMVTDNGSPDAPALAPRAELATSGQGLTLVTALAARWGHHGNQQARTVWFEIDCR